MRGLIGHRQVDDPAPDYSSATDQPLETVAAYLDMVRRFARRRWKLIAVTSVLGAALSAASFALMPQNYEAAATILIDKQRLHFFVQQTVVSDPAVDTHSAIEGQL